MPQIIINDKVFKCDSFNNVSINDDCVYVNSKKIPFNEREIKVEIHGDVEHLNSIAPIEINGSAKYVECSGSCVINGDVSGDVDCSGSVTCGNIGGRLDVAGSVTMRR